MVNRNKADFRIIDAHLHLPWPEEYPTIEKKLKRLQEEMHYHNIEHGLLISDSLLETNIGNNEECLWAVNQVKNLSLVFAFSPLSRLEEQLEYLEELLKEKKLVGLKLYPGHEDYCLNDPRLGEPIKLCLEYQIPLLIHTEWNADSYPQYGHPYFVKQLAEKNEDLKIVACHVWLPRVLESFQQTQELKNVYYDFSAFCMGEQAFRDYPNSQFPKKEKALEYLRQLVEACPERVLFGSDYGSLSIGEHLELVFDSQLTRGLKEKILFENANELFKLKL